MLRQEFIQFLESAPNKRTYQKYAKWIKNNNNFTFNGCANVVPLPPSCVINDPTLKVVAIGDLHGDFCATKECFQLAGILKKNGKVRWEPSARNTMVVQTGDIMDAVRSGDFPSERSECLSVAKIFNLIDQLNASANEQGFKGRIIPLIGNHEMMNLKGNHAYAHAVERQELQTKFGVSNYSDATVAGISGFAKELACRTTGIMQIINDTVFVHGSISPHFIKMLTNKLNVRLPFKFIAFLVNNIVRKFAQLGASSLSSMERAIMHAINDKSGLIWYRGLSKGTGESVCPKLQFVFKEDCGIRNLVVGHTVQSPHITGIACQNASTSTCPNRKILRIFKIDAGMSMAFQLRQVNKTFAQILVIDQGRIAIQYLTPRNRIKQLLWSDKFGKF